jgi:hypothetical protein
VARTKNHIQIYSLVGSSAFLQLKHHSKLPVFIDTLTAKGAAGSTMRGDIIISGAAYIINRLNGNGTKRGAWRDATPLNIWGFFFSFCFVERLELMGH